MRRYTLMIGRSLRLIMTLTDARTMLRTMEVRLANVQRRLRSVKFEATPEQYDAVVDVLENIEQQLTTLCKALESTAATEQQRKQPR